MDRDLDLVEVAPDAKPPVCRILDYSKYKYEQNQKQKAARKHQQQINVREIKFRPKIAQHDYDTKKGHVERFLKGRDKVKVTIMFRGREMAHPERGEMILNRLAEDLGDLAVIEQRPQQDGRNMTMMLAPQKAAASEKPARTRSPRDELALDAVLAPGSLRARRSLVVARSAATADACATCSGADQRDGTGRACATSMCAVTTPGVAGLSSSATAGTSRSARASARRRGRRTRRARAVRPRRRRGRPRTPPSA